MRNYNVGYYRQLPNLTINGQLKLINKAAHCDKLFSEPVTAPRSSRRQFLALLNDVQRGDKIYIARLDCLSMSLKTCLTSVQELFTKGVKLIVLQTPLGRMTFDHTNEGKKNLLYLELFADFEKDVLLQKSMTGRKKSNGTPGRKSKISKEDVEAIITLRKTESWQSVAEAFFETYYTSQERSNLTRSERQHKINNLIRAMQYHVKKYNSNQS